MLSYGSEKSRQLLLLVIILLVGASLRLYQLESVPPGLTHDEADHGLDAWGIVEGNRPVYLTTANGREPLFDYTTALLMSVIGRHYLAGRLTAVFFGLIFLAASFGWSKQLFSTRVALLTTTALAVGFWPIMVSRHMLRTITMPALLALALLFFLNAYSRRSWSLAVLAGLSLGLSFYSYIPARALWVLLPLLGCYWFFSRRQHITPLGYTGVALAVAALAVAALIGLPLFQFLRSAPEAEARIGQLQLPLDQALAGDFAPLWQNIRASLRLFFLNGDTAWRYNLAGQPWLGPAMALLFGIGLLLAIFYLVNGWRRAEPYAAGSLVALAWLGIGFVPAAITGPELATTQAVGVLSVLYIFPALALDRGILFIEERIPAGRPFYPYVIASGFLLMGIQTAGDYFDEWANHPEVRLQYESTLVTVLNYLEDEALANVAISTAQPGRFHAQAVAALIIGEDASRYQWFDGRSALAWPGEAGFIVGTGLAPVRQELINDTAGGELEVRADDIDRPVHIYLAEFTRLPMTSIPRPDVQYRFGEHIQLAGISLPTDGLISGTTLQYITEWDVLARPDEDWVLFTHVSGDDGVPVAQQDLLAVPSDSWRAGDRFYQLHEIPLPTDLPAGSYNIRNGFYYCPNLCAEGTNRIDVWEESTDGALIHLGDILDVTTIQVIEDGS